MDGLRAGRRRRARQDTARSHAVKPRFSAEEFEVLTAAAGRAGLSVGAYLATVGMRAARSEMVPLPTDWREVLVELAEDRVQVQRVGVLLNQLAKATHRTGQAPAGLPEAMTDLARVLRRLDDVSARAHRRLR